VVARFRVTQLRASLPVLEAALAEAQANLASAQAALERSTTALREATIRCPIQGVVLVRDKEVGDGISSILTAGGNATQLLMLGDLSQMFVEARVDEVDLGRIQVGMPAAVTVDAYRDRPLEGRVERIAPAGSIDENGIVTFQVRVKVEDPGKILRPDMTADAKLILASRPGALVLPQKAFVRGEDGAWNVQLVRGGPDAPAVELAPVQLGLSDGLTTEVLEGLSEGDLVLLPDLEPRRGGPP
jgi:HlyD family secretion protein